ncbi:hypothetical protein PG994_014613 [Apiospora phragmitis]|uniref:Uncharacterized protein n=1 Tax=Apiospora phragmitis TaxID=2905665 RepID=A0ABR1T4U2_9PEZI
MNDNVHLDKRRGQSRDSQRRFRKKLHKGRTKTSGNSWTISSPPSSSSQHLGHPISDSNTALAASLPSGSPPLLLGAAGRSSSRDHATSYFPTNGQFQSPAWISSKSYPPAGLENWTDHTDHHRNVAIPRHVQHQQYAHAAVTPAHQMGLPPSGAHFPPETLSMPGFEPLKDPFGANGKDNMIPSPISLLNADLQMHPEPSPPQARPPTQRPVVNMDTMEMPPRPPTRRGSGNTSSMPQAEQMISDVGDLHEFGVELSIFLEDMLLLTSLRKMKERFRSLVLPDYPLGQGSAGDDMDEDSSQDSDSEGS